MAGFQMTLSSFRLNEGLPICPFHRRGTGTGQEPGRYQKSDGSFGKGAERANWYTGTRADMIGDRGDGRSETVDIKPYSRRVIPADRSRPASPLGSPVYAPAARRPASSAGHATFAERCFPVNTPRELPAVQFEEVREAFNSSRGKRLQVKPVDDPLYYGVFDAAAKEPMCLHFKPPQGPTLTPDLVGVGDVRLPLQIDGRWKLSASTGGHKEPVRRYYTSNQMFYNWPSDEVSRVSLAPGRRKTGFF